MGKTLGIVLAVIALLALLIATAMLCHGLIARRQMNRCKNSMSGKNKGKSGDPAAISPSGSPAHQEQSQRRRTE